MHAVLVIPLYFAIGIVLRRFLSNPEKSAKALNHIVLGLAFPALIFLQLPKLLASHQDSHGILLAVLMPWVQFALITAIALFLLQKKFWTKATAACVILTCGLGNTSFVGFPLIELFYGDEGLRVAVLIDQLGTFLVLSTLGIFTASLMSGRKVSLAVTAKKIFTFPPFLAMLLALAAFYLLPSILLTLESTFSALSKLLVPCALISVGLQLNLNRNFLNERKAALTTALTLKLFLIPLIFFTADILLLKNYSLTAKVTILESAMAPMITGAIVATEFGLDPNLASLMVSIGIPISLLTVYGWKFLLSFAS
jgi:predicted permease